MVEEIPGVLTISTALAEQGLLEVLAMPPALTAAPDELLPPVLCARGQQMVRPDCPGVKEPVGKAL